jgi:hypothetical protein
VDSGSSFWDAAAAAAPAAITAVVFTPPVVVAVVVVVTTVVGTTTSVLVSTCSVCVVGICVSVTAVLEPPSLTVVVVDFVVGRVATVVVVGVVGTVDSFVAGSVRVNAGRVGVVRVIVPMVPVLVPLPAPA